MSSTDDMLYITASNLEKAETLVLEIPEQKAKEYFSKFEYDFEQLASCLRVEDRTLVLLNPFFHTIQIPNEFDLNSSAFQNSKQASIRPTAFESLSEWHQTGYCRP